MERCFFDIPFFAKGVDLSRKYAIVTVPKKFLADKLIICF